MTINPLTLVQQLISCRSVTPQDGGAIELVQGVLTEAGFSCSNISRGGIQNLYARYGHRKPVFGYSGHVDVVPVGKESHWTYPPFGAEVHDEIIWGRGAQDMKSSVAAFVCAAIGMVREDLPGSIAIMITGDEEGSAVDGTRAILDFMNGTGQKLDHCIVGEPTSLKKFGDMIKIGRRGSMNVTFLVVGKQGHTAYPHQAINAASALNRLLFRLEDHKLDEGSVHFGPSTLVITDLVVGNETTNIVPGEARGRISIRFNDNHSSGDLSDWLREEADQVERETGAEIKLEISVSGESFLTPPNPFTDLIVNVLRRETGEYPELSTSGGTSDARFISDQCPVVEVGLVGDLIHQTNERVPVSDFLRLLDLYGQILEQYFARMTPWETLSS